MKHRNLFFVFLISILLITTSCATVHKSPLIEASIQGNSLAAEKLISEGANINEPDSNGVTPLIYAIRAGNTEIAKSLIKSGADIKIKDKKGVDALICAVDYGRIEIVNTLLDRGANIETKDQTDSTPLAYAVACGHYDIIELLLNRGADIILCVPPWLLYSRPGYSIRGDDWSLHAHRGYGMFLVLMCSYRSNYQNRLRWFTPKG